MYVEEYETQVIRLQEYVSGGLVNYRLDISYKNESETDEQVAEFTQIARDIITITKGSTTLSQEYLRNTDLASVMEPLPRSTVMLDDQYGNLMMYFIDSSFYFNSYCVEGYLDRNIVRGHFVELDRTIITGQCSNLKNVIMNDQKNFLILFCLSTDKDTRQSKLTVVQIRDFDRLDVTPKILYYTQDYYVTKIDFQYPVRFVSNFSHVNFGEDFGLFMARMMDNSPELRDIPLMLLMNFTIFDEIFSSGQASLYQPMGGLFIKTAYLNLTSQYNDKSITDYKTIFLRDKKQKPLTDSPNLSIALVIEGYGLLLCNISDYRDLIKNNKNFTCIEDENSFLQMADGAFSVHHEPLNPEQKVFLISAQPVKITEYEVENFRNTKISKVYMAQQQANKRYISTSELTVNMNWVVLCIRDIYSGQNMLRVFARNTTFFRVVMQDIPLPALSRTEFVQFPNYFLNSMIYRDERSVNITLIASHRLIVNRSESAMEQFPQQKNLNGRTFSIKISHENQQDRRVQELASFEATFVDQYSTEVYPSTKLLEDGNLNIFYSCGDKNFKFDLNQLYNGPEYILNLDSTKQNGSDTSYFKFQKSSEVQKYNSSLNSTECEQSILVPQQSEKGLSTMLMVCVTIKNARFVSYIVNIDTTNDEPTSRESELIIDNDISIPSSSIMKFLYDTDKKVIIAIVKITDPTIKEYIQEQYQVHYLKIGQTLCWKNMHSLNLTGFNTRDVNSSENFIDHFTYSEELQKGLIAEDNLDDNGQNQAVFMVFDVDLVNFQFTNLKRYPPIQITGKIMKAEITNDRMFVVLTSENAMQVFQIFPEQIKAINKGRRIKEKVEILSFDIFDMRYLVLYNNDSTTDVYDMVFGVQYVHRMRLPKYIKFENYTFKNYKGYRQPIRDYFENTLALMMTDSENNETAFLVYKLNEPQHNSLYVSNHSISDQMRDSDYSWIALTGDSGDVNMHYFGFVSDNRFQIIQVRYYDTITVDMSKNQQLISQCKDLVTLTGMDKNFVHNPIQQISIYPTFEEIPAFERKIGLSNTQSTKQNITVTIQSANLGLALQPIAKTFNVTYQHSSKNKITLQMAMGQLLQGYNMQFEATCHYGQKGKDCQDGLIPSISTVSYQFPISFVTATNQVVKAVPIARYFWMLDAMGKIRIEKVPDDYDAVQNVSLKQPMSKVAVWDQMQVLGCRIDSEGQFSKMIWINTTGKVQTPYRNRELFLFFYQCFELQSNLTRVLRAVEIAVLEKDSNECAQTEESCIKVTKISNSTKIVYGVTDVGLANLTFYIPDQFLNDTSISFTSAISYKFDLVVVCNIEKAISNIILIYNDAYINGTMPNPSMIPDPSLKSFSNFTLKRWNSAAKNVWDTFEANSVATVPDSKFVVVSMDGFGAIIYHTGRNEIVYKLNLTAGLSPYSVQDDQLYSETFRVWDAVVHYPNHIYIFTNRGFVIYGFDIDLSNEHEILGDPEKYFPKILRTQRFPYQVLSTQVCSGPYGFILLQQSPLGRGKTVTKLTAVTFFQATQSKLYRSLDLGENFDCHSFHRVKKMEISLEDQLSVSLVCNQRLHAVRFCLRPNFEVNLTQYADENTLPGGHLGYNEYHINVTARNEFSEDSSNVESVLVRVMYGEVLKEKTNILSFIIFFLSFLVSMFLFLFLRTRASKDEKMEEIRKVQKEYIDKAEHQRKSMMIYKRTDERITTGSFIPGANTKIQATDSYTEVPESAPLQTFPTNINGHHTLLSETDPQDSLGNLEAQPNIFNRKTETTLKLIYGAKPSTCKDGSNGVSNSQRGSKSTLGEIRSSSDSQTKESHVTARFNRTKDPGTRVSMNIQDEQVDESLIEEGSETSFSLLAQ